MTIPAVAALPLIDLSSIRQPGQISADRLHELFCPGSRVGRQPNICRRPHD